MLNRRLAWLATALLAVLMGCDDGGGDDPTPEDAEVREDMRMRMLADAAVVDQAVIDMAPVVDMTTAGDGSAEPEPDIGMRPACNDGRDNDRDGVVDFPDDPGCESPDDDDETDPPPLAQCDDRQDNDGDGLIDTADPDCSSAIDTTESGNNDPRACSNGEDDDEDGLTDFPYDPGCVAAGHVSEVDRMPPPACANGMDDDGNGTADFPEDPGCVAAGDESEAALDPPAACGDGADNDGSGATDWPADPGCDGAGDLTEVSPCGPDSPVIDLNRHLANDDDFVGDLTDVPGNIVAACGGAAGGEFVFRYVVERELDRLVFDTRHPETEAPVVMYLRDRCDGPDLQCDRGLGEDGGVTFTVERPVIGTAYFLIVDTGSRNDVGRFRLTVDAVLPPACRNGVDDDADGLLDVADPGCVDTEDDDEADPMEPPVCSNGLDDDMDGFIDWPDDVDCVAAGAPEEVPPCTLNAPLIRVSQEGGDFPLEILGAGAGAAQPGCEAGFGPETVIALTLSDPSDVEFQVLTANGMPLAAPLHARSACEDPATEIGCRTQANRMNPLELLELDRGQHFLFAEQGLVAPAEPLVARIIVRSVIVECNDQIDNDDDGLIDLEDIGCEFGRDESERDPGAPPQCADGIDNDMNGVIDWPDDEGCLGAGDLTEEPLGVHLGLEVGFGHHGSCDTFNACNNAQTCANAGCRFNGHGDAIEWQEGRCQDVRNMVPNIRCQLFRSLPDSLDAAWGGHCNIPIAYDITCAPN